MPVCVVVPNSCNRARGTASLCMNTRCVLQEDSSKNDEVFQLLYFSHVEKFLYSSKHALYFINYLFFPYIPSCEARQQFGAEPAQYGLEISFKGAT